VRLGLAFGAFALFIAGFASRETAGILVGLAIAGGLVAHAQPWRRRRRARPPSGGSVEPDPRTEPQPHRTLARE
jgi:hypothetical protein